jgi:hypothetical protein
MAEEGQFKAGVNTHKWHKGVYMLEIRKAAVSFDEQDIMELERIAMDGDKEEALKFVKKAVYDRILHSQQGKLKSHLDAASPVEGFIQHNK